MADAAVPGPDTADSEEPGRSAVQVGGVWSSGRALSIKSLFSFFNLAGILNFITAGSLVSVGSGMAAGCVVSIGSGVSTGCAISIGSGTSIGCAISIASGRGIGNAVEKLSRGKDGHPPKVGISG